MYSNTSCSTCKSNRCVSALALVLFLGTVVYAWLESMQYVDALYFTVVTATTVGFGDCKSTVAAACCSSLRLASLLCAHSLLPRHCLVLTMLWAHVGVTSAVLDTPTTFQGKAFTLIYVPFSVVMVAAAIQRVATVPLKNRALALEDHVLSQFGKSITACVFHPSIAAFDSNHTCLVEIHDACLRFSRILDGCNISFATTNVQRGLQADPTDDRAGSGRRHSGQRFCDRDAAAARSAGPRRHDQVPSAFLQARPRLLRHVNYVRH